MPNMLYLWCLGLGHDWRHVKRTPNWDYYECRACDRRSKEPR